MKSERYSLPLFIVAVALIVEVSVAAVAESGLVSSIEPVAVQLTDLQTIDLSPQKSGARDTTCSTYNPGLLGYNFPGLATGNETFYVYTDPASSSCIPKIPFGITGMKFVFCYDLICSTNMVFKVFDAIPGACPRPGALLYTSPVTPIHVIGGPGCIGINISFGDTVCVNAPFFLAYTFPDPVSCFNIVRDTSVGLCRSYKLTDENALIDLYTSFPPLTGQLWMQAFGLNPAQSGCATIPDTVMDITAVYQNISSFEGKTVRVLGDYVHPNDSKLVTSYSAYEMQQVMLSQSIMFVTGVIPDSLYWHGGVVEAVGNISRRPNPTPVYPNDTFLVTINVLSYDYHLVGDTTTRAGGIREQHESGESETEGKDVAACDPCKFAILISGGADEANNKPGFWKDIEKLYNYNKSLTPAGGNYCAENLRVLYFNGASGNPTEIADADVDSCSKTNINAVIDSITAQILACKSQSKETTVQSLVTNHGSNNGGAWMLGDERVLPAELRDMQQRLIDAGCDVLIDEFTEGYGGDMVNGLKGILDQGRTEIHANSAAGENSLSWVGVDGGAYLDEKIARLSAGDDYETAVAAAKTKCAVDLAARVIRDSLRQEEIIGWLNAHSSSDPDWNEWQMKKTSAGDAIGWLQDALNEGSPSFVRYQFESYCEWKKIVIPPGGQSRLEFNGRGGCGNVSVYCEQPDGSRKKVKVWNWNLPGSFGYSSGNEVRVLNTNAPCTGAYWIHNDNGDFTVTAEALKNQTLSESPSNDTSYCGFSAGGRDSSSAEFGNIIAGSYVISSIDSIGRDLRTIPSTLGAGSGVASLECGFTITSNSWWDSMEVVIQVNQMISPGTLQLRCPNAQIPLQQQVVNMSAHEIILYLDSISAGSPGQLVFDALSGLEFSWDSWGLRTRRTTSPQFVCGDANADVAIDISDAVYLIAYIFAGGPAPSPLLAGDSNCDQSVDISDAVFLISYIFGGGPAPCAGC